MDRNLPRRPVKWLRANRKLLAILLPLAIFLFALILRLYFFNGFVLGDDPQEFQTAQFLLSNPVSTDQLQLRFGVWIFNLLSFKALGVSEFAFFLPTLLMSASFGVIGYFLLLNWGYPENKSFLAGLLVAAAPFEVLMGTLRANDVIFSWFLAMGLLCLVAFERKPLVQGLLVAVFGWLAFNTKLWAVFMLAPLAAYYLARFANQREWTGAASFAAFSIALFVPTICWWHGLTGQWLPFLTNYAASYPVTPSAMTQVLAAYPLMIFSGSDLGSTLFGSIPYLLLAFLALKMMLDLSEKKPILDVPDRFLVAFYGSFFLFMEFFPDAFTFTTYYSVPRIFRYLAPISFVMALHVGKLALDIAEAGWRKGWFKRVNAGRDAVAVVLLVLLISVSVWQAGEATAPGREYRQVIMSVSQDVKTLAPPALLVESWQAFFFKNIYLNGMSGYTEITPIYGTYTSAQYEDWLVENQPKLLNGTVLLTGFGSYVFYRCVNCGFLLDGFGQTLDPGWRLYRQYPPPSYSPTQEPVRLWIWRGQNATGG